MTADQGDPGRRGTSWPKVSVVVPTRKREELLRRALRTIVGQRYEGEVEAVVVFDQEDPQDPGIEVGPGRSITVIRNERSQGLAGARNSGILAATGDLVAYCDDDDEWLPDKIRRQVEAMRRLPHAEVVVTGTTIVYDGKCVDRVIDHDLDLARLLRSRVQAIHPSSILVERRAVIDGIGLVDEEIPGSYGEDYEWLLRAARRAPIRVVPVPLVRAHWHRASYFADRWTVIVDAIHYLLDRHPEFQDEPRGLSRLYSRLAFAHAAMGQGSEARRWAGRSIRLDPTQRRAYLAVGVSLHVVSAQRLMRFAHRHGRGL